MNVELFYHIINKYRLDYLHNKINMFADCRDYYDSIEGIYVVELTTSPNNKKNTECEHCHQCTYRVKDKHTYSILHAYSYNSVIRIDLIARKYKCKVCGQILYEENFLSHNGGYTYEYIQFLLKYLSDTNTTFTSAASYFHRSKQTIERLFDSSYNHKLGNLPEILGIDDKHFYTTYDPKTNKIDKKFFTTLIDVKENKVIDLIYSVELNSLKSYILTNWTEEQRSNVKYVTCDLAIAYNKLAKDVFPNCQVSNDWWHVIHELEDELGRMIRTTKKALEKELAKNEDSLILYYKLQMLDKYGNLLTIKRNKLSKLRQIEIKGLDNKGLPAPGYYTWSDIEIVEYLKSIDKGISKLYDTLMELYNLRSINYYGLAIRELNERIPRDQLDTLVSALARADIESIIPLLRDTENSVCVEIANRLETHIVSISNSFIRYRNTKEVYEKTGKKTGTLTNAKTERHNREIKGILLSSDKGFTNFKIFRKFVLIKEYKDFILEENKIYFEI